MNRRRRPRRRWRDLRLHSPWLLVPAVLGIAVLGLVMTHKVRPPRGQVLATVDGSEITVQDVQAEARASGVPDFANTRNALLEQVISRRLLAASAKRQHLDRTPTAPSDLARLQQNWLAQLALRRILAPIAPPDAVTVAKVRASHPYSFAKRTIYTLDTLTIIGGGSLGSQLRSYTNLDAAQAFIKRLGVPALRRSASVDSAQLPLDTAQRFASLPNGALLVREEPGRLSLTCILTRASLTPPGGAQDLLAQQLWASETTSARVRAEVSRLKAASRIVYAAESPPS